MDRRLSEQIEPVCKFGPGGDFVSFWPDEPRARDIQPAAEAVPARKESIRYPFQNSSDICSRALLFDDDCRIKLRTARKPRHHIRAYHRTAKKSPALSLAGQGMLFEAGLKSAKTA
ncbi:MAG: hypothetical protein JSV82_00405 [Planctomycetota bacterium]|nr:MAG: hypothetical protein JSV82_00405 [Planctomycetota bacterium]